MSEMKGANSRVTHNLIMNSREKLSLDGVRDKSALMKIT